MYTIRIHMHKQDDNWIFLDSGLETQFLSSHSYYFCINLLGHDTIHHILRHLRLKGEVWSPRRQALDLEVEHFQYFCDSVFVREESGHKLKGVCFEPTLAWKVGPRLQKRVIKTCGSLGHPNKRGYQELFHALFGLQVMRSSDILGDKEKVVCGSRSSQAILCGDFFLSLWEMPGVLFPC